MCELHEMIDGSKFGAFLPYPLNNDGHGMNIEEKELWFALMIKLTS